MRMQRIHVENYRSLRDVEIPLSHFVCLIGENNAGKSSVLQAMTLFHSGTALDKSNFFDPSKEIRITIEFAEIDHSDLARLADEHRNRIQEIVCDGQLTIVRLYDTNGKSKLKYRGRCPIEPRFQDDFIRDLCASQRPGRPFATKVVEQYPELEERVTAQSNQGAVKDSIAALIAELPADKTIEADRNLPTGVDASISALLPEPIYIAAVKDLSDDVKAKESTPFGKLIRILLDQISDKLNQEEELFKRLNEKLNRIETDEGTVLDNRLAEVREIETTIERYLQESFASVTLKLKIPPPELKTVFAAAQIWADDGVDGLIDTKGDGMRRASVFAILRSFVALRQRAHPNDGGEDTAPRPRYLLLFEEPELYLHPHAQGILFDALRVFSQEHFVALTTHSPAFLGPDATATFVKLSKELHPETANRPYCRPHSVDLSELGRKDQFQIICYENNNAAFFAQNVVLVEGPSDILVFPHIARLLNPEWDGARVPVRFARINGKTSIRRYRDFFSRFGVRTPVIADLDLLVSSFDQLDTSEELQQLRSRLLQMVDATIEERGKHVEMSQKNAKKAHGKGELKALWIRARQLHDAQKGNEASSEQVIDALDEFFVFERKDERCEVLRTEQSTDLVGTKRLLLEKLREIDVYVLERGAIEEYYPAHIEGRDKPTKAQDFCANVNTRDLVLDCCDDCGEAEDGECRRELHVIFERIFSNSI